MIRKTLEHFLDQHDLWKLLRSGPLLVGVSGGADSVALLRVLHEVTVAEGGSLVVAHYDHALREDSAADACWVQDLCGTLGLVCEMERRGGAGSRLEMASEDNARRQRYDFFCRVLVRTGGRGLVLAHTADDQVETILHHLIRGSGLKGLQGMPAVRALKCPSSWDQPLLLRPFLPVARAEIEAYLQSISQSFRTDPTNFETNYTRNRLRHTVLPLLRTELNPRVDQALLQLARQAMDAQAIVEQASGELLERVLLDRQPDSVRLQRILLLPYSTGQLRALLALLWELQDWPRQSLGFVHLQRLAEQVLTGTPPRLSLPKGIESVCRSAIVEIRRHG